jgi:hypothetical protein
LSAKRFLCKIERLAAVFRNDSWESGSLSRACGRRNSMVAASNRRIGRTRPIIRMDGTTIAAMERRFVPGL